MGEWPPSILPKNNQNNGNISLEETFQQIIQNNYDLYDYCYYYKRDFEEENNDVCHHVLVGRGEYGSDKEDYEEYE